mgnify:CR=1 FL=1
MSASLVQRYAGPVSFAEKLDGKKTDPFDGRNSLFAESGTTPLKNTFIPMPVFFKQVVHSLTGY